MKRSRGVGFAITQWFRVARFVSCIALGLSRFAGFCLLLFVWCEQQSFVDSGRWANAAAPDSSARYLKLLGGHGYDSETHFVFVEVNSYSDSVLGNCFLAPQRHPSTLGPLSP